MAQTDLFQTGSLLASALVGAVSLSHSTDKTGREERQYRQAI